MPPKTVPAPTTAPSPTAEQHETTDVERLAGLLEQLGADVAGGFTAYLERLPRPGVAQDLVGYLGPTEFSASLLDDVAGTHGGGKFRARIHDARGKYKTSFTFTVAGAPKRPDVGISAAASGGASSAVPESSRLERLIEGLAASVAGVVEMVKTQSRGHSLDEVIQIAKTLKELTPAPPPATSTKEMLETIETVMDIRERLGGGGDGQSDFAAAVAGGVKPLVSLGERYLGLQEKAMDLRARGQLPPARSARAAAAGAGAPSPSGSASPPAAAPPAPSAAAVPAGEVDLVAELARSIPVFARKFLRGHAAAGNDPETYAIMALETIREANPETFEILPQLLELPDFTARMLQLVPEWQPHGEWFAQMFADMKAQLAAGDDVDELEDVEDAPESPAIAGATSSEPQPA